MPKPLDASVAFLQEQLAALDQQREALDQQRVPIAKALAALQEPLPSSPAPAADLVLPAVAVPEEEPALASRIVDVLRKSGPLKRAQLVKVFRERNVNPSTLDSAVYRLKRRGVVDRRGGAFFLLEPQPSGAGGDAGLAATPRSDLTPSSPGDPSGVPDPDRRTTDLDRAPAEPDPQPAASSRPPLVAPTNRARVLEAVVALGGAPRSALVKHLEPQGLRDVSVASALSGLCTKGVLERRADGVYVVADASAS